MFRWFSASALVLTACNGTKSLGDYDTDDATGGSGGEDGSGGTSASISASGAVSVTAGGTSAGSDDDASASGSGVTIATSASSDDVSDTGTHGACNGENDCILYPIDCADVQCGGLSQFDDDGCVRTVCTDTPQACSGDEHCYRPMDFGGCQSSAVGCIDDEENMICQCNSLPDCGGAYCVPEADWPSPDVGPSDAAVVRNDCAPNDGPAYELRFGLDGSSCDASPVPGAAFVSIRLDDVDPAPGTYVFGAQAGGQGTYDSGDGTVDSSGTGWVVIDAWDETTVSGTYHLVVPEIAYLSADFDAAYCAVPVGCG